MIRRRQFTLGVAAASFGHQGLALRPVFADGPPDPKQQPATGDVAVDNVYYGAQPPGGEQRPVLLFVHGLGGLAQDWWLDPSGTGTNDMYATAYGRGYRTVFVTLNPDGSRAPSGNMHVNGRTLAAQVEAVAQRYGTSKIVLVAHSKGGLDAQAAIVESGAAAHVSYVFTLSTPHLGSELADFAFTKLGQKVVEQVQAFLPGFELDDALASLQTESVKEFRSQVDQRMAAQSVRYICACGNEWGDSALKLTGQYLAQFGPNDSLVTVASSLLPGAPVLFIQPFSHFSINFGASFRWIHTALQRLGAQP